MKGPNINGATHAAAGILSMLIGVLLVTQTALGDILGSVICWALLIFVTGVISFAIGVFTEPEPEVRPANSIVNKE